MLLVDAANVVGSRPTGWWRDRAGAARKLYDALAAALESEQLRPPVVAVFEGAARRGVAEADDKHLRVVHAPRNGDDTIVALVEAASHDNTSVTVVTADRELRERVQHLGAEVVGPRWLLDQLP
jgi:predicted RNA-binding protein with PIN domain